MRHLLVTGAAAGIGRAIAEAAMADGWRVTGLDRTEVADAGFAMVHCDLARTSDWKGLIAGIESDGGALTALVNNASIYPAIGWRDYDQPGLDELIRTNLVAPFFLTQTVAGNWIDRGQPGSIVNLSSIAAASPGQDTAYGMCKAAISNMTVGLARQLAQHKIRVNGIAPGIIDTPMARSIPAELLAEYEKSIPIGRLGRAEEVAAAALFLLSDPAAYVTGEILKIDGGLA